MLIVSSPISPNVREIGSLQPCCKTAALENGELTKRKPPSKVRPNSCVYNSKDSKMTKNVLLKSYYCPEELKNPEYGQRVNRSHSMSTHQLRCDGEGGGGRDTSCKCDVTFVRKLLALNKKEEVLLNKALTKLLKEKQFGNSAGKHFPCEGCVSASAPNFVDKKKGFLGEKMHTKDELSPESRAMKNSIKPLKKAQRLVLQQYDLNGRRIYHVSDDDPVEEDDKNNVSQLKKLNRGKTWISSISVKKCDEACNSTGRSEVSKRKHSTEMVEAACISQPAIRVQQINQNNSRSEEGADEESSVPGPPLLIRAKKIEGGLQRSWGGGIQGTNQGDGVQNVVVHCSKVAKDDLDAGQDKRVLKVWDFNNIPKIKSGNRCFGQENLNRNDARVDERISDKKGNRDEKTIKAGRQSKLKTDKTQSSRKNKNPHHELI